MNFFTSVFSDDPHPSDSDNAHTNEEASHDSDSSGGRGAWELWKTLSAKSESIIETYRRDLQEFGTGLKKEIEVAHGSLETVGHVIDQFGNTVAKGTDQIISHGILDSDFNNNNTNTNSTDRKSFNSLKQGYSRFDAQVRAIQGDADTFTEVPEDLDEYNNWKSEFSLEGKSDEMEGFLNENEGMESVYKRVVPSVVDDDTFWFRYYYRVYRLKKAEDVRARLVGRLSNEDEDLSWDLDEEEDDDDDDDVNNGKEGDSELHGDTKDESVEESKVGDASRHKESMNDVERKVDDGKDSLIANKNSGNEKEEEEDLDWDEIEDISRIDQDKETRTGIVDMPKNRLGVEEEDLSWDIEDGDDQHAKA